MKGLILSHFNNVMGPRVFLSEPNDIGNQYKDQITELMNLYRQGFFLHEFGGVKTANLIFEIKNSEARGGVEILMISLVVLGTSEIDYNMSKQYLEKFAERLDSLKNVHSAFHADNGVNEDDEKASKELDELFHSFHESFPDISILNPIKASIFVYGLTQAGKTTIVQSIQNKIIKENPPTISMDVSQLVLENLSIMVYDAPGQEKYRDLWAPHIVGQDGLVFVVDISEEKKYDEAMKVLKDIATRKNTADLPLLILLNKIDIKKPKMKTIKKYMNSRTLGRRPLKLFKTCAVKNEGVQEAFSWLAKEMVSHMK
ncbi:GTP-binding protein [Candidatus Bathyarchaeota archaeon]|nr:GTP-binding protein [Candidatus Bathyarchaeota archaeon]